MNRMISYLALFAWIAALSSQSLIDLVDFFLVAYGIYLLNSGKSWKDWKSFTFWPRSTGLEKLWLVWIFGVIASGIFNNVPPGQLFELTSEFRWIYSFEIYIFLFKQIQFHEKSIKQTTLIFLVYTIISLIMWPLNYAEDPRAGGLFFHSMPFAHTYGPASLMVAGFSVIAFQKNLHWRWLSLITSILSSAIVTLSLTRGIWIAMLFSLIFLSFQSSKAVGRFLSIITLTMFLGVVYLVPNARNRVLTTNSQNNQSDSERKRIWIANWNWFTSSPVLGIGYKQNSLYLNSYIDSKGVQKENWAAHAHNQFLNFLSGLGILGFCCFIYFCYKTLETSFRQTLKQSMVSVEHRAIQLGVFSAQVCFLIGGLTESNFSIAKNRFFFLLITAVSFAISSKYSNHSKHQND